MASPTHDARLRRVRRIHKVSTVIFAVLAFLAMGFVTYEPFIALGIFGAMLPFFALSLFAQHRVEAMERG